MYGVITLMLTFNLPVEVYFAVSKFTTEEMILDLMGKKILSNQLLTGQEVGGTLVPEDASNVLQVAVNRLLRGVKTRQASGIFTTQNTMTSSSLGSPTALRPRTLPAMTLQEWLMRHPLANKVQSRQNKQQPQSQLTLSI